MKKLYVLLAALLVAAMLLPACAPAAADCTSDQVFCVGLVTDVGKINDKSFNQSAWEGVQQGGLQEAEVVVTFLEPIGAGRIGRVELMDVLGGL